MHKINVGTNSSNGTWILVETHEFSGVDRDFGPLYHLYLVTKRVTVIVQAYVLTLYFLVHQYLLYMDMNLCLPVYAGQ